MSNELHPPLRQEQVDDFMHCYQYVNGECAAYDRIIERVGEDISPEILHEREDLGLLRDYYKRMLDGQR